MQRTSAPLDLAGVERSCSPTTEPHASGGGLRVTRGLRVGAGHLFEGSWMCIGRTADLDLGAPGGQVAVAGRRQSFLLVRGDDWRARFHNVCRHRGHELLGSASIATSAASGARTTRGSTGSGAICARRRGSTWTRWTKPTSPSSRRARRVARLAVRQRER